MSRLGSNTGPGDSVAREAWLQAMLESIGDGIIATEARGAITFMNPAAEALTGWTSAEAREHPLDEVYRIVGETSGERMNVEHADGGELEGEAIALLTKEGARVSVEHNHNEIVARDGRHLGVVIVFRDVRAARRERQRRLLLARAATVLFSSLDYQKTLSTVARLAIEHIADWCEVELVDAHGNVESVAIEHVDPAQVELVEELRRQYPATPSVDGGTSFVRRTGEPLLAAEVSDAMLERFALDHEHYRMLKSLGLRSYMVAPLRLHDRILGTVTLATAQSGRRFDKDDVAFVRELAAQAAVAVENARLYHQVQEAVTARDEFLSIASHELKTPLTPLLLQIQMLSRRVPALVSDPDGRKWFERSLAIMQRQSERLSRLVTELLDISRLVGGRLRLEPEQTDLSTLVEQVVREVQEGSINGQRVRTSIGVELEAELTGCWDPLRIEQVISNLISNAVKYGEGRPVTVCTRSEGDLAILVVQDQGIGIPKERHQQIFGRFERAVSVRHYGGLGLGLYIVQQIVTASGGTIAVESAPGSGTIFTVSLPRAAASRGVEELPADAQAPKKP